MNKALQDKGRQAIARCLNWAQEHEDEITSIADLNAHYKAPYFYSAMGDPIRGRRYADMMKERYLQPDGDFRTGIYEKGWYSLPCSPANRYVYSNGWIVTGLRRLGYYDTAKKGIEFVRKFQSEEYGGFYSRYDIMTGAVNQRYLDSSSTSSAGLALLACGYNDNAARAGDFILKLLEAQPDMENFYYSSWDVESGIMTKIWGDEDQNSLHGRKQFCLTVKNDARRELTWLIGKPMKFLAKLFDQTGEDKYLNGAIRLFDFFHKLQDGKWYNLASCKIMWASAELYRHTGNSRFAQTSEKILDTFCSTQDRSGTWLHDLWYERIEDQPVSLNLDIVQELGGEIADTLFELS